MAVYQLRPHYDISRWYPKPPYVEKRKCRAFRCKNRRSVSFPWIKDNPWCTDHSKQVYFSSQGWEAADVAETKLRKATPATNVFGYVRHWWRHRNG